MSQRTETAYKAKSPGKSAQHNKAQGSGDRVNAAVVYRRFTLLNRVPFRKFNGVNVLIRGDLSAMRDVAFLVRLPEGATGIQRSRHLLEGLLPEDEIRN